MGTETATAALFTTAARQITTGRRRTLQLSSSGRWTELLVAIHTRLRTFPAPAG